MLEREITGWIDLSAASTGWSRRALHRARVDGPWGRRKRWHHWAVTSSREVVTVTIADLDYLGIAVVGTVDRASGARTRRVKVRPFGWGAAWPDVADRGRVEVAGIEMHDRGGAVTVRAPDIELEVSRPAGHDTLGVATAWSADRYAYSSKQFALPVRGTVHGRAIAADAFACLDWGRGVWPARTSWNWASAAGTVDRRVIGLNLGARWTRGVTENAVIVDGKMTKLGSQVTFTPGETWRLTGDDCDLALAPEFLDGVPGALQIAFGTFTGTVGGLAIPGLFGWAERLDLVW